MARACSACCSLRCARSICFWMAWSVISLSWCLIESCEKITQAATQLTAMRINAGASQLAVVIRGGLYFLKYIARSGEHIQQAAPKRHGGRRRGFRWRFRRQLRLFHTMNSGLNAAL